jgi:hypothetical protein
MANVKLDWLKIRSTGEYVRLIQYVMDGGFRLLVSHEDGSISLAYPGDVEIAIDPFDLVDREAEPNSVPRWYTQIVESERGRLRPPTRPPARAPTPPRASPRTAYSGPASGPASGLASGLA